MEIETIRLLYMVDKSVAVDHIRNLYQKHPILPLDLFGLSIRFWQWDYRQSEPLLDEKNNELRQGSDPKNFLEKLKENPDYGSFDAPEMLLGAIANHPDPPVTLMHFKCLANILEEPNVVLIRDVLQSYVNVSENYTYDDVFKEDSKYALILEHFRRNFPTVDNFAINTYPKFPHWQSWEQIMVWNRDCCTCLSDIFREHQIELPLKAPYEMFAMLDGEDDHIKSYSVGQAIKYINFDHTELNTSNVEKPIFPIAGQEAYITGVWMTYIYHFCGIQDVETDTLKEILLTFGQRWNIR